MFPWTLVYRKHDQVPSDNIVKDVQSPEPVLMCLKVQVSMADGLKVCVFLLVMMARGSIRVVTNSYQRIKVWYFRFVPEEDVCLYIENPIGADALTQFLALGVFAYRTF